MILDNVNVNDANTTYEVYQVLPCYNMYFTYLVLMNDLFVPQSYCG